MTTKEKEVIMFDSKEAATYVENIKGWIDKDRRFFGDNPDSERIARWSSHTHKHCDKCEQIVEKHYTLCGYHNSILMLERWKKMPEKEWDGKGFLYSDFCDKYFSDWSEIEDEIEEIHFDDKDSKIAIEDLQLVICEPEYLHQIDPLDIYEDLIPEDGDESCIPNDILDAFDKLNALIRKDTTPIIWHPGLCRVKI